MSSKKLKVKLLKFLVWFWKEWDIIEVNYTYAKNYLIPKNFAKLVTPEMEKQIQEKIKHHEKITKELILNRHQIAEVLHGKELIFETKWTNNKSFGSIQEQDIVDKIKKDFWVTIEKKVVILPEGQHIKKVWIYDVKIDLWKDTYIKMNVELKINKEK